MNRKLKYTVQFALVMVMALAGFAACTSKKDSKRPPGDGKGVHETRDIGDPDKAGDEKVTDDGHPRLRRARGSEEIDISRADDSEREDSATSQMIRTEQVDLSKSDQVEVYPTGAPGPYEPSPKQSPEQNPQGRTKPYHPVQGFKPYFTGASDTRGQMFTDAKNDRIMSFLRMQMDQLEGQYREDSMKLAQNISDVLVETDWSGTGHVKLSVRMESGPRTVRLEFEGYFNNNRQAELRQTLTTHDDLEFVAYVSCMDQDRSECENTVITLDQIRNGEVCKSAFIVHRWGDAHAVVKREDYYQYEDKHNMYYRYFANMMANTVKFNKNFHNGIIGEPGLVPRFKRIGLRTFAVAYGPAFFRVKMQKLAEGDPAWSDTVTFTGPLLTSYDGDIIVDAKKWNEHINQIRYTGGTFGDTITNVRLWGNSGMGQLKLKIRFQGSPIMDMILEYDTIVNDAVDPFSYAPQSIE